MNSKRSVRWALLIGASSCAVLAAMAGCELVVDFDRSKIPTVDASLADGEPPANGDDAEVDGGDAGATEGDAGDGGGPDATIDAGVTPDAGDAGVDASAPPDTGAPDTGVDAASDSSTDEASVVDGSDVDSADQ
jgi:hypothetical protein